MWLIFYPKKNEANKVLSKIQLILDLSKEAV